MQQDRGFLRLHTDVRQIAHSQPAREEYSRIGRTTAELTYMALAREWGQSIEFGNTYSAGHCLRVAQNAVAAAQEIGLDEERLTVIRVGAYLHNVGRVRLSREIQQKAGPLSREELDAVEMVPVWGTEILANVHLPWDIKPIVRWHNEKFDGSGYPDRLRGDDIPLSAQIVGITNVYDALTTGRMYRAAMSPRKALEELTRCRGWWSKQVFEACVPLLAGAYSASLRLA